jgi:hypothetical protein
MEEEYRLAVKDAVLRHKAGLQQGAAQLEAVGVRPPRLPQPVPHQGCLDLSELPHGREVEGEAGALVAAQELALQPVANAAAALARGSVAGSQRLLAALQQYHRWVGGPAAAAATAHLPAADNPALLRVASSTQCTPADHNSASARRSSIPAGS